MEMSSTLYEALDTPNGHYSSLIISFPLSIRIKTTWNTQEYLETPSKGKSEKQLV